ncbi:phosphotransferase [Candidatus Bipolaricaulota bacterium]|nr:phosphotransferase [Candidatus Bipolaricaulota bacterium]
MKPLHELTQIGRGRRLRPIALQVLDEDYGIAAIQLKQITEASNTIFRVITDSAQDYVLRMTAPKSCHGADEIRSEVAWLHAIDEDTDIGIPVPVARLDGDYVSEVLVPVEDSPICSAVYSWVPGRMLDEQLTEDNVRRLGSLMARLHEHAASFVTPKDFRIRTYDSVFPYSVEGFAGLEPIVLFNEDAQALLTSEQRSTYRDAYQLIAQEIESLMRNEDPLRVIHSDLHMWNVKVDGDKLYALDFEDMMWGHPIQDIATTMYYFRWADTYETMLMAFRSGYEFVQEWPESCEGQLETLMAGRMLLLANYVAASEDSEDRAFAPEYLVRCEGRLRSFLEGSSR